MHARTRRKKGRSLEAIIVADVETNGLLWKCGARPCTGQCSVALTALLVNAVRDHGKYLSLLWYSPKVSRYRLTLIDTAARHTVKDSYKLSTS